MRKICVVISALWALFAVTACSDLVGDAKKIVQAYNEASILAYRTGDTSRLREVAGAKEAHTIGVLIDTKRAAGLILESVLEQLEVTSVKKTGSDGMSVETRERWRYHDSPVTPGRPAGPVFTAEMTMRYTCAQVSGKWKVMKVVTIANSTVQSGDKR